MMGSKGGGQKVTVSPGLHRSTMRKPMLHHGNVSLLPAGKRGYRGKTPFDMPLARTRSLTDSPVRKMQQDLDQTRAKSLSLGSDDGKNFIDSPALERKNKQRKSISSDDSLLRQAVRNSKIADESGSRLVWKTSNALKSDEEGRVSHALTRSDSLSSAGDSDRSSAPLSAHRGSEPTNTLPDVKSVNRPRPQRTTSASSSSGLSELSSETEKSKASEEELDVKEDMLKSSNYWKVLRNRIKSCQPADIVTSCVVEGTIVEETKDSVNKLPTVRRQTYPMNTKGSRFYKTVMAAHAKAKQGNARRAWLHDRSKLDNKDGKLISNELAEIEQYKPKFKCSPHFQQTLNSLKKGMSHMLVEDDDVEESDT